MPDGSSPALKESFQALLAPVLLNSALAAVRLQPPSSSNAGIGVKAATRALTSLELSASDRGTKLSFSVNQILILGLQLKLCTVVLSDR